jgi:hypothetical protein
VGVQEREDVREVDPLRHAEEDRRDEEQPHVRDARHENQVGAMPGRVKTVIRSPTCPLVTPNASLISGSAGVMLETREIPAGAERYARPCIEVSANTPSPTLVE